MELERILQLELTPLLERGPRPVFVAYSGGLDSSVLLYALKNLENHLNMSGLHGIHVHHGLSEHADDWQQHCKITCEKLGIEFVAQRVHVPTGGQGLEAEARKVRYTALLNAMPDDGILCLGQHLDDQFETLLLQLKRGAGPKGLSGMPALVHTSSNIDIVRPLLPLSREQLADYAEKHTLSWVEDDSNQDAAFDRNFLRNDIIPRLLARWPQMNQAAARSAALCAEQQQLLDEVCADKLARAMAPDRLIFTSLLAENAAWQRQLLRFWLSQNGASMPSMAVLEQIGQMLSAAEDANPQVHWDGWQVRRYRDALYLLQQHETSPPEKTLIDQCGAYSITGHRGYFQVEHLSDGHVLLLSSEPLSMRFRPEGAPHSKPLKQWLKQWGVPPWLREQALTVSLCASREVAENISEETHCVTIGVLVDSRFYPAECEFADGLAKFSVKFCKN